MSRRPRLTLLCKAAPQRLGEPQRADAPSAEGWKGVQQPSIGKGNVEQQIQELAETIQLLRQSQIKLAAENERLREGQASVQALAQSVGELAQSLKKGTADRKIFMDTKGLGRLEVFDNKERFRRWTRSINNLVARVFGPDYDKVLECCLDSEDPIDLQDGR